MRAKCDCAGSNSKAYQVKEVRESIRKDLRSFADEEIGTVIYEMAASFFNTCRGQGIQGSLTDFLISACAVSCNAQILSKDRDCLHYQRSIPVGIYEVAANQALDDK